MKPFWIDIYVDFKTFCSKDIFHYIIQFALALCRQAIESPFLGWRWRLVIFLHWLQKGSQWPWTSHMCATKLLPPCHIFHLLGHQQDHWSYHWAANYNNIVLITNGLERYCKLLIITYQIKLRSVSIRKIMPGYPYLLAPLQNHLIPHPERKVADKRDKKIRDRKKFECLLIIIFLH